MKYIVTLSVVLFSTHCLLAQTSIREQDKDRLEVVGYRLEDTRSREQDTGNREQGRNTNQATGYRLQVIGCRETELALENQRSREQGRNTNQATGYRLQVTGTNQNTRSREQNSGNREQGELKDGKTDEEVLVNGTADYESLTDNSNDECDEDLFNPVLMGGPMGVTTTASRWLFKTGSNKIVTRPFVGLGGESSRPLLPSSTFAAVPFTSHLSPLTFTRPLAFRPITRSFSSIPPIKDNTLNSASKDLTQNKKTIEELKEDVDKREIASAIAERKAVAAKGENEVKLWEESKKEDQAVIEVLDQYIAALQEIKTKTPLTPEIDWNQRIEAAQDHRLSMVCSTLSKEAFKASIIASIVQDRAVAAQGEEAVRLWEEAKKADEVVIEAQDQYIKILKEAQAKAPLAAKAKWNQYLEQVQNQRASRACNIFSKEANRLLTLVSIAEKKAMVAKGEEAVKFWEESQKVAQTLLELQDQYIASLQEAKGKAPEEAQVDWGQCIEVARHNRDTMAYSLLSKEASRLQSLVSWLITIDESIAEKAILVKGEEAVRLWEESKKMHQTILENQDQYLVTLQEVKIKAPISDKADKAQRIETAQDNRARIAFSLISREASRLDSLASIAKAKASVAQGEEAMMFWEKSHKVDQASLESYDQCIAIIKKNQAEAPLKFKAEWDQYIEDIQKKRALKFCDFTSSEVNRVSIMASIVQNKATDAQGEDAVKLFEESKKTDQAVIEALGQYIEALQEAQVQVPLATQAKWNSDIEEAYYKRAAMVCNVLAKECIQAKDIDRITWDEVPAVIGKEAVQFLEKSKQAAQAVLKIQEKYIEALQEAQSKAPLAMKAELSRCIEKEQERRNLTICSIFSREIMKTTAIYNSTQDEVNAARGEEAVQLLERSKQLAQAVVEAFDQEIIFFQEVQIKSPLAVQSEWLERIREAQDKREVMICNLLGMEVRKTYIIASIVNDKAAAIQGEKEVELLEESKKADQAVIEILDQYIEALKKAQAKTPFTEQAECIEDAENMRASMLDSVLAKEAKRVAATASAAQDKAAAIQDVQSDSKKNGRN